ncbi:hypothetical protein L484_006576 [Morus notabilis]|uniref:Uncharacterized protein n=1 Tax=Morus notabilis TaxID=981085 RepID=W9S8S0_9ROSA|nr:hypothetical protein L484_006576 [Morus notabilis]
MVFFSKSGISNGSTVLRGHTKAPSSEATTSAISQQPVEASTCSPSDSASPQISPQVLVTTFLSPDSNDSVAEASTN